MSAPAFAWALEMGVAHKLLAADRLVLIYLADKANGERLCWPGQELVVKYTGLSPRTVVTSLQRLESAQLIRADRKDGRATRYQVMRDTPANQQGVTPANGASPQPCTPANGAGVTPANQQGHPCKSDGDPCKPEGGPLQISRGNLDLIQEVNLDSNLSPREAREEGEDLSFSEKGSEAQPPSAPDTTEGGGPVRRPPATASDDPAMTGFIGGLARSMQNNYPPRAPVLDRHAQIEVLRAATPVRTKSLPPEYLAAIRKAAGYGLNSPA